MGMSLEELERELLTPEEIAESNVRAASRKESLKSCPA